MCGICGTVGFANGRQLAAMTAALAHRGPDDQGVEVLRDGEGRPLIGLGHRRLSIIDLSPAGHQPMPNDDRNIWLVYNGEIYNFKHLRSVLTSRGVQFRSQTDTEVILRLYLEHGLSMLGELNGMFALAIWDGRTRTLILARDRFGIKPLYFAPLPSGRLAFASEAKSLFAGGILQPEVNQSALEQYLSFLWVPAPDTLFKGVCKLLPGHVLVWQDGIVTNRPFSRASAEAQKQASKLSGHFLRQELLEHLEDAVTRQLVSDVPVGVFLSGGLDSSALLALATRISNRSMRAYTITFRDQDGRHEQSDQDKYFARVVARHFGAAHHEIELSPNIVDILPRVVWHMDEPLADPAAITSYLICQAASSEVTVLLSGQGGDEIFGGYSVYLADLMARRLLLIPAAVRKHVISRLLALLPLIRERVPGVTPGKVMAVHRYASRLLEGVNLPRERRFVFQRAYYEAGAARTIIAPALAAELEEVDPYRTHLGYFRDLSERSFVDQMLQLDQKTFLPELNLLYSDKTSMAHCVEVRVPLLDDAVVDFMESVPARNKVDGFGQKLLFKHAMEGILPKDVIWRRKAPFSAPVRTWLRGDLDEMLSDLLSARAVTERGWLDPAAVETMLTNHREGRADHSLRIWSIVTLELWARGFIDPPFPPGSPS